MFFNLVPERVRGERNPTVRLLSAALMLSLLVAGLGAGPAGATGTVRYVSPGGMTSGICDSWVNACKLQYAISVAAAGDQLWVEEGLHKPPSGAGFIVENAIAIYGGFAGTESALSARDWKSNVTILSGDIDNNDTNTDGNNIDETTADIQGSNSLHVVWMNGVSTSITSTTVLDGFTITGGQASGGTGGGLYCGTGISGNCSPTLTNLVFSGNLAQYGGGLYDYVGGASNSSPSLVDVTFSGNHATSDGGAMYDAAGSGISDPVLNNVTFSGNTAGGSGGAMLNFSSIGGRSNPTLANVTFSANTAGNNGGAMHNGTSGGGSSPVIINVTFNGNSAGGKGGAIFNTGYQGNSNPTLVNAILWGDSATTGGAEVYNDGVAYPAIYYSVVAGGCGSVSQATCGAGNRSTDPLLAALADNGGDTRTMALQLGSSAMDTGNDGTCANPPVYGIDQRGVTRPQHLHCDMGAYEYYFPETISGNAGLANVPLGYLDGTPKSATADGSGDYSMIVPWGWSGAVTPFAIGYGFAPANRSYSGVIANQTGQNFTATALPMAGTYDEADSGWTYSGAWVTVAAPGLYHNSLRIGASPGSTATFGFYGDSFSLTYLRYTGWGNIGVYLDGSATPLTTINCSGAAGLVPYDSPHLVPGAHTVVFKHAGPAGSFIAYDSLDVHTPSTVVPADYDFSNPAWTYTGVWIAVAASGLYNNTLEIGAAPGGSASLLFHGTGFSVTYLQYTGWGNIAVYLDGSPIPYKTISTSGAAGLQTYTSPILPLGDHMVKFVHAGPAGKFIAVDYVTIAP